MMRRTFYILGIIALFAGMYLPAIADEDCDLALKEARQAYNAGNYSKAKGLYDYVVTECGASYGNAGAMSKQCANALTPTLSVSRSDISVGAAAGSTTITVTSNRPWKLQNTNSSVFTLYVDGNTITINYTANSKSSPRSDFFTVVTSDGSLSRRVQISQSASKVSSSNQTSAGSSSTTSSTSSSKSSTSSSSTATAYLSLSKTSISASSSGTTEYITINTNREWVIVHPTGSMYSVTRYSGSMVKVVISPNYGNSRQDFFIIKTKDESKSVRVNMSQAQSYQSSSYSNSSSRSRYKSSSGYSALRDYNNSNGKWEVEWFSGRIGLCTGFEMEVSALAFRYSVLKIEPLIFGYRYDFINGYDSFYYQPDIKLVFPWNSDCAVDFGIGPSISGEGLWFTTELGIICHWNYLLSSDFFIRYDGILAFGVSFNFSTGF